ncbi:hypothetical protein CANARDRAFT_30636, partial [[Candida] arabinofermentans NRRL YB-2248]
RHLKKSHNIGQPDSVITRIPFQTITNANNNQSNSNPTSLLGSKRSKKELHDNVDVESTTTTTGGTGTGTANFGGGSVGAATCGGSGPNSGNFKNATSELDISLNTGADFPSNSILQNAKILIISNNNQGNSNNTNSNTVVQSKPNKNGLQHDYSDSVSRSISIQTPLYRMELPPNGGSGNGSSHQQSSNQSSNSPEVSSQQQQQQQQQANSSRLLQTQINQYESNLFLIQPILQIQQTMKQQMKLQMRSTIRIEQRLAHSLNQSRGSGLEDQFEIVPFSNGLDPSINSSMGIPSIYNIHILLNCSSHILDQFLMNYESIPRAANNNNGGGGGNGGNGNDVGGVSGGVSGDVTVSGTNTGVTGVTGITNVTGLTGVSGVATNSSSGNNSVSRRGSSVGSTAVNASISLMSFQDKIFKIGKFIGSNRVEKYWENFLITRRNQV